MRHLVQRDVGSRPVVVAGSTWPADEQHLLATARRLTGSEHSPVWVLAPHEPTAAHLDALERDLAAAGLKASRMAAVERGAMAADALIVDRVGVLADLYAIADVAYVGGGFHAQGLHSVVEPAAVGVPVLFGPRHGNAREASELARERGGFEVDGADAVSRTLAMLLADPSARANAGAAARRFVEQRLGAADRNAALVADLIETRRLPAGTEAT